MASFGFSPYNLTTVSIVRRRSFSLRSLMVRPWICVFLSSHICLWTFRMPRTKHKFQGLRLLSLLSLVLSCSCARSQYTDVKPLRKFSHPKMFWWCSASFRVLSMSCVGGSFAWYMFCVSKFRVFAKFKKWKINIYLF